VNQVAVKEIAARLPMPQTVTDIDAGKWRILCESIFPSAKTPEAIAMAVDYCRARKLDILKKPVHIVPMWSESKKGYVETVWPSITEIQITASRTGQYAGMDEPKWGPDVEREFKGKIGNNAGDTVVKLTVPEWCSITVYRLVDGQRCAFTEPVYWLEAYGRIGKTELPNEQWKKRPRGMLIKVSKAFSIRAGFPEEGDYSAEEMDGRTLEDYDAAGILPDRIRKNSIFRNDTERKLFTAEISEEIEAATTTEGLTEIQTEHAAKFAEMRDSGIDRDGVCVDDLCVKFKLKWNKLVKEEEPAGVPNRDPSSLPPIDDEIPF